MFKGLIGNENVKSLLTRLAANGRVPNALLFAGPEGVGKKLFAFELARMLLCRDGGCGSCPICTRIGVFDIPKQEKSDDFKKVFLSDHPDVGVVVPFKRNILVDAIRELEREANFRPFEAERRIFVINDADRMNDSSSNALLKTLEEPPSTTYLILITSRPDALLHTVRSRCQVIRFAPVPNTEIENQLASNGFPQEDARLAARVTNGSVGKALSLDVAWFRQTRDLLLNVLSSATVTGSLATMLQASEQLNDAKNKDRFEDAVSILESLIRDVFAISKRANPASIVSTDIISKLNELAAEVTTLKVERWIAEIEELQFNFLVNINRKVATDGLFVKMAA